jgi:hypothetical protein
LVIFIDKPRCDLGINEGLWGLYCLSAQYGNTQFDKLCRIVKFNKPLDNCIEFSGINSVGRVLLSIPLISFEILNMRSASGGTLKLPATQFITVSINFKSFIFFIKES